ncbi:zincin-like metallopeptidase domain-containing protein [soil metagenome]
MNAEVLSHTRFDVYRAVTDSIIAAIEAGAGEFIMPWHGDGVAIAKPQNALTQMEYHGVNVLALWAQAYVSGYRSGFWASYKQWQNAGAQVVKGAEGSTIVFFKRIEGEPAEGEQPSVRLVARASRVFNADQVAGWEPPAPTKIYGDAEITESVETFIAATKAEVHRAGSIACYRISDDYIEMPELSRFTGSSTISATEAYSATLLHELIHWAGARHRLARFGEGLSKEELAAEELVAEIGAAFLCADLGVSNQPRPDHAAYVAYWLQLLKNDARAIFTASRLANQAAMYLHELASIGEY